jgi:AcrR family transcriptional regulator
MAVSETAPPRRQRADAERNRRALLDAAVEVFGERGLDATVSEIARRAGVGQGTAFRHFPTKEHLIAAVVAAQLDQLTQRAIELLDEPDALLALRELLHTGSGLMIANQGFKDAAASTPVFEDPAVEESHRRLLEAGGQLLARAQATGAVREDLTAEDIPILCCAVGATDIPRLDGQPALWERYFELIFAGLCAPVAGPLAATAPTQDELRQLKKGPARPAAGSARR